MLNLFKRPPDVIIGGKERPYMRRWWIIPRNRFFNIYLHNIMRSDDDRALHDHPWWNCSILLKGEYIEVMPTFRAEFLMCFPNGPLLQRNPNVSLQYKRRRRGSIIFRKAEQAHRLTLIAGAPPVWTLFITGPRVREWGFHCPKGWKGWREFSGVPAGQEAKGDEVGPGCEG